MLYGVYHLKDLTRRLEELKLELEPVIEEQELTEKQEIKYENKEYGTEKEWRLPAVPTDNMLTAWTIELPATTSTSSRSKMDTYIPHIGHGGLVPSGFNFRLAHLLRLVINAVKELPSLSESFWQSCKECTRGI